MDIFEFELRFNAFAGLSHKFDLQWEQKDLIQLVQISNKGVPDKKIQEISPEELKELTLQTYSSYKQGFLQKAEKTELSYDTLANYIHRLEYELKVIKEMGFNTYMLIVADFVNRARENDIVVGPGRGSGAGSMLAWLIGITDLNPFAYDLLFERFLNPARISMPDFDIDFEDTEREKVIQYVTQKYGADKVCYIGTYMKMATKAAFKDAARAMGVPFDKANGITAALPEKHSLSQIVATIHEHEEIQNIYSSDDNIQKAFQLGGKLEGNLRQTGVHACGVIIAPEKVTEYTAIKPLGNDNQGYVSQYDGPTLETIGLLKMDFLGLRNLGVIKNTIKIIAARHQVAQKGEKVLYEGLSPQAQNEYKAPKLAPLYQDFLNTMRFEPILNDTYTFEKVFQEGDTSGIFQFEGQGMRRFLVQLESNDINDLIAMNALYRPGPLEFIPTYIKRKHGKEKIEYMLPVLKEELLEKYPKETDLIEKEREKLFEDLDPIMGITYGIAVYQEQLMKLVQSMAGFSLPEADLLRRGVGKKKKKVIEKLKKEFIERSQSFRGYKPETGKIIYEKMIEPAASYSFNKSHSACYSHIAYQTGYLKAHYPLEFYAALLRSVEEDSDKLSFFVDEILTSGLHVHNPDVNKSYNHVAAVQDHIIMGFLSCKGIGYSVGEFIEQERKNNGLFESLEDFLKRCESIVNKKTLGSLIKSGALDQFHDRKTLRENLLYLLDRTKNSKQSGGGLFGGMDMGLDTINFSQTYTITLMEKLLMDYEIFKTFISGHPFDGMYPLLKKKNFISQFKEVEEFGDFEITAYIKKIQRARKKGFFITIEDSTDSIEIFVKELLDFKLFDIFHIKGYKQRSTTVSQMTKLTLEELREKAQKKKAFDPERTAAKVKATRKSKVTLQQKTTTQQPTTQEPPKQENPTPHKEEKTATDNFVSNNTDDNTSNISEKIKPSAKIEEKSEQQEQQSQTSSSNQTQQQTIFSLPESMTVLQKVIHIIKENSGDIHVHIGTKKVSVSQEGLEKIQALLQK